MAKLPRKPFAPKAKKTKAVEIAEFRAEVNKYLNTGISDVLTIKEKANLDKVRLASPASCGGPSFWDKFLAFLKK